MKKSEAKFIENWKKKIEMGRLRYGFLEGSIFGLLVGIFTMLLSLLFDEFTIVLRMQLVYDLIIWMLGGILGYLTVMWEVNMYYYKHFLKKNGLED
ncbi:hypothetical protein [Myroides odoratus]|uniref:Uncharacterized protein n=1 Tax=Myroides odoratus TaxID=256 RepID=A0A9Q6ZA05_MYROD|nr:hypothetical protein [Myroides odoratus]EHQ42244.1 hypothetical protein Myrod_1411 [Myroides odoratus DSM 2801]EKB09466.1 hypothetical protein HMPREF9716_00082 [Myroides odoratus CIP 103059]QQT99624.1 hypothetical protein I6I88_15810 [Myroides odoratus]WQD58169.1 hypothetical protein U0010_03145 [Myroides odoratus]STZ29504.1 Uncharacterised protein [Myroides odoratus]